MTLLDIPQQYIDQARATYSGLSEQDYMNTANNLWIASGTKPNTNPPLSDAPPVGEAAQAPYQAGNTGPDTTTQGGGTSSGGTGAGTAGTGQGSGSGGGSGGSNQAYSVSNNANQWKWRSDLFNYLNQTDGNRRYNNAMPAVGQGVTTAQNNQTAEAPRLTTQQILDNIASNSINEKQSLTAGTYDMVSLGHNVSGNQDYANAPQFDYKKVFDAPAGTVFNMKDLGPLGDLVNQDFTFNGQQAQMPTSMTKEQILNNKYFVTQNGIGVQGILFNQPLKNYESLIKAGYSLDQIGVDPAPKYTIDTPIPVNTKQFEIANTGLAGIGQNITDYQNTLAHQSMTQKTDNTTGNS